MKDDKYDPELLAHGDTRNVTDEFRGMTVEAIKEQLDMRRHPPHKAIENFQCMILILVRYATPMHST